MTITVTPELLADAGIPLEEWGVGEAKTLAHLVREVANGECQLQPGPEGLVRTMLGATVTLTAERPQGTLWLHEDRQVFADGRVRRRDHLLFSIGEKLAAGETPRAGAQRALAEELGMGPLVLEPNYREDKVIEDDYPGLPTHCTVWNFVAVVPDELFVAEGYVERQDDKSTFFIWSPRPFAPNPHARALDDASI